MQASKIKVGTTYALRRDEELVRFLVCAVVTRRERNHDNPHDYKSTVEGYVTDDENRVVVVVKPDKLLGPYTDYVELVERSLKEREVIERAAEAKRTLREQLRKVLYRKVGIDPPTDPTQHSQMFRAGYSGIDISDEGIRLLHTYLT